MTLISRLQILMLAGWSCFAAGSYLEAASGPLKEGAPANDVPVIFRPPAAESHLLGLVEGLEQSAGGQVVVRDLEIDIDDPVAEGERVVLTTVGALRQIEGESRFQPLLSVAVDLTFREDGGGQWLAIWNLGEKTPNPLSYLRAALPGWAARKRADKGVLRKLERKLEQEGRFRPSPSPSYVITDGHRSSFVRMALNSVKIGAGFISQRFWGQFVYRGYLLRRGDQQQRRFQHTYLGLNWYDDYSAGSWEDTTLSPQGVRDLKFRMLSNRSMFGRWVLAAEAEDFVHGYENELRDHLWGTSNRLAADANDYHLGYEEFHRYTQTGVPLSLGGILYYDPKLAPEAGQLSWSLANPFDLTYNPFTDPAVLKEAQGGNPVPLALYTFQSNMALKPIITVDFFRPNNPRVREAATYWRRLGNEAIASSSIFGLFYNGLRRGLTFMANRKGVTWLSDSKVAMGVEELRLSLMGHLYFEPRAVDSLLDKVDRVLINPLTQSSREQRLRAQLQYGALTADGGKAVLAVARRIREKLIRRSVRPPSAPLQPVSYRAYKRHLRLRADVEILSTYSSDIYAGSLPTEVVAGAIRRLGKELRVHDEEFAAQLADFHFEMRSRASLNPGSDDFAALAQESLQSLKDIHYSSGMDGEHLHRQLAQFEQRHRQGVEKKQEQQLQEANKFFGQRLAVHTRLLQAFVDSGGDLYVVSPWYLSRAAEFLEEIPELTNANALIAKRYKKKRQRVENLFNQVHQLLQATESRELTSWMRQERETALAVLSRVSNQTVSGQKVGFTARGEQN